MGETAYGIDFGEPLTVTVFVARRYTTGRFQESSPTATPGIPNPSRHYANTSQLDEKDRNNRIANMSCQISKRLSRIGFPRVPGSP